MVLSLIPRFLPGLVLALAVVAHGAAAETLSVTLDKTKVLRPQGKIAIVMVGNPDIAEVTVETPNLIFLLGLEVGETNLLLLDAKGNEIAAYDVVVAPEKERHVTVHRGPGGVATLSCDPRCTGIENPGTGESEKSSETSDAESSDGGDEPTSAADLTEQLSSE